MIGGIESTKVDRVTQYAETDVGFLKRLASEYGYAVKVVSDQLIFSHLGTLHQPDPVKQLSPADVARYSLRNTIKQAYKSAKLKHQKSSNKKLVTYHSDENATTATVKESGKATSADTLKVTSRSQYKDSEQLKADVALDSHNEYQQNGSLTLMGMPQLTADSKIELVKFGQLFGQWLITSARHSFDRSSGYVTELEVARGPVTNGKKKIQTLTVYKSDGTTTTTMTVKEKKK